MLRLTALMLALNAGISLWAGLYDAPVFWVDDFPAVFWRVAELAGMILSIAGARERPEGYIDVDLSRAVLVKLGEYVDLFERRFRYSRQPGILPVIWRAGYAFRRRVIDYFPKLGS